MKLIQHTIRGVTISSHAKPSSVPTGFFYRFTAGVFEVPVGGTTLTFDFTTDDPAPIIGDFPSTFSHPTQIVAALNHISGQSWQLIVNCEGGIFVDNFYRRQEYDNSTGPDSAFAATNWIKFKGNSTDTPGYPANNNPINWP